MSGFTVKWNGDALLKEMAEGATEGIKECIEDLFEKSGQLCPFKTGKLLDSQYKEVDAETLSGWVGFDCDYAAKQHWTRWFGHDSGQALFLSEPLEQNGRRYLGIVAESIRRRLWR